MSPVSFPLLKNIFKNLANVYVPEENKVPRGRAAGQNVVDETLARGSGSTVRPAGVTHAYSKR